MSTATVIASEAGRSFRPSLDGADPLTKVVAREITLRPRQDVTRQGDVVRTAHLVLTGYACRYRLLADGRRQITAILVPGDLCDVQAAMRGRADFTVETLTPCVLGEIPVNLLHDAERADPDLHRAVWRQVLLDEASAREWLVVLGRRSARERLAHLLCELRERLRKVGVDTDDIFPLDLTQKDLADALGLSAVHVNRTVQDLRNRGLIEFGRKLFRIVDPVALADLAGFDPGYLDHRCPVRPPNHFR